MMRLNLQFEPIEQKHIPAATKLVMSAYREEQLAIPFLPAAEECLCLVHQSIEILLQRGTGVAALQNGELVGFLAGWLPRELFGKAKGVYIPLYGHGAIKEERGQIYQEMYRYAANLWVQKALVSHAITLFTHDEETINTWFWLGFGMRCVDAIRQPSPIPDHNLALTIKKADLSDIPALAEIHRRHHYYYVQSPIFMPREEEDPVQDLTNWLQEENRHLWVAYHQGQPVGYMKIQPDAETFISEHPAVMNITGAYVLEDARQAHIGATLLGTIQNWLFAEGYPLCGVDFEAINTVGSSFWRKYFTPYTYSVVRRIDERVLPAE